MKVGLTRGSTIGYRLAVALAVIGIAATVIVFRLTREIEQARVRNALDLRVEWRARDIQNKLNDGLAPISVLAVAIATDRNATEDRFNALATGTDILHVPVSRLAWEPRVMARDREAFENNARKTGHIGYRITELSSDGRFIPAASRDEYFPVRFEKIRGDFPTNPGFDLASDPARRLAIEQARDLGDPVALQPTLRQTILRTAPSQVIYWPLYKDNVIPATIVERRNRLNGYVTAVIGIEDLLRYALENTPDIIETIVFSTANTVVDGPMNTVASYIPGVGISTDPASIPPDNPSDFTFVREFTVLHQGWSLEFRFTPDAVDSTRSSTPYISLTLGLLITAAMVSIMVLLARRSQAARMRLLSQGKINTELTVFNDWLAKRERVAAMSARSRTRFLAAASHDLRQPLHALALFASALQRRVSGSEAIDLVNNIQELCRSMQRMFNSLLDLSRLDSGAIVTKIGAYQPQRLISNLVAEFSIQAREKGLSLRAAGVFPTIGADPALLEAILRNLIGNAIKFTRQGGILIAGRRRQSTLTIEIWDTGPGIPADKTDDIFEEFERLESPGNVPGFGLGLSIVRRLCTLMDTDVRVCSKLGHGSRFSVSLPLASAQTGIAPVANLSTLPSLKGFKVFVVDNDSDVRRAMQLELQDWGCAVQTSDNGDNALAAILGGEAPDLLIIDLHLGAGQRDGWAVVEQVQTVRPQQVIVLITGSTEADTLEKLQRSGLPSMIKPIEPDQLRRLIAGLAISSEVQD